MAESHPRRARPWGLLLALLVAYLLAVLVCVLTPLAQAGQAEVADDAFVYLIATLSVVASTVGAVILWKRPGNLVGAMLLAGAIILVSGTASWPIQLLIGPEQGAGPGLLQLAMAWWVSNAVLLGVLVLFPGVAIVFPDGRLPGPRFRVPVWLVIGLVVAGLVCRTIAPGRPSSDPFAPWPGVAGVPYELGDLGGALSTIGILTGFVIAIVAVVVRFRRSQGVERAQMKWLIASVSLMALLFSISWVKLFGPSDLIDNASVVAGILVPIAIGIAVLRYHLYDIDRIVSRTLGWAIVSGVLVAVFAGLVVALQALLAPVTKENTLAVAASTLVAFALFQPLRRRVQRVVDRRFDRARYDGQRTVDAFAEHLRSETDIDAVLGELSGTTRAAVSPIALGVWIRSPEGGR